MTSIIQNRMKTFLGGKTGGKNFFICSLFLTITMGIVFRSQGYFNGNISLWLDEAEWVFKLSDRSLLDNAFIRPVGFLVATRFLISIVNNEITLRLMSYSASILSLPLIYLIAKEVFKWKLTVFLAVFIIAFNPALINFAKEFKPYSLELFLHLLLLYLLLQYIKLNTASLFNLVLLLSVVILFFAYNIVFLYPSLFMIVLWEAYKKQNFRRVCFSLSAVILLICMLYAFYHFIWSTMNITATRTYWGGKYDVFCLSSRFSDIFLWSINKYFSLVTCSGTDTIFWDININGYKIMKAALLVVHCIGLAALLVRRKWNNLLLFVVPIVIVLLSNILGLWPFGAFRTNVFLFCYFVIISLYGVDTLINIKNKYGKPAIILVIITLFIVLPFPLGIDHYKIKVPGFFSPHSNMRYVLDTIFSYELSKEPADKGESTCLLFADYHSFFPVKYYVWKHTSLSKKYERFQSRNALRLFTIGLKCDQISESINKLTVNPQLRGRRAWILLSKRSCFKGITPYFWGQNNTIMLYNFEDSNLLVYYQF